MSELAYFDALKRIASYSSPQRLQKECVTTYGLDYVEALEMAYENIQIEAKSAVRGKRRPVGTAASDKVKS